MAALARAAKYLFELIIAEQGEFASSRKLLLWPIIGMHQDDSGYSRSKSYIVHPNQANNNP